MTVDDQLSEVAGWIHGERPMVELLDRVAAIGREVIPAADEVSVVLVSNPHETTIGSTSEIGRLLDERQRDIGRGPCLDAAYGGEPVVAPDLATDPRWPKYTPLAVELGIRSSLSAPLPVQDHVVGAVDWYSRSAATFTPEHRTEARWYAARVATVIANLHLYGEMEQLARSMQLAMETRAQIEQAKGIIMATARCGPDEAFQLLVQQSQHENRKLREIAAEIVDQQQR
jgi:GAF domain-containing protein